MGDRANVLVRQDNDDPGVYLYTHWGGSELPKVLQNALARRVRWNDAAYLTRIIFDEMTKGYHDEETGFGISTFMPDGQNRVLIVNCDKETVLFGDYEWTFDVYLRLSDEQLVKKTWGYGQ